jgi:hypothetical protein
MGDGIGIYIGVEIGFSGKRNSFVNFLRFCCLLFQWKWMWCGDGKRGLPVIRKDGNAEEAVGTC